MGVIDQFHDGRLDEAIAGQLAQVRDHPTDPGRRVFLAELLAFSGDLDRARRQVDAIPLGDPKVDRAARDTRDLLDAQAARLRLFASGEAPRFFADRPDHCAIRLDALDRLRAGDTASAASRLAEAAEAQPDMPGTLDGRAFARIRDTDDRLGGVLEVLALGRYYWVPLEQITGLAMNPPKYPRDLLFIPARLELGEEAGEVFLPALYPGSSAEADPSLKLGRLTEWRPLGEGGPAAGLGAKVFQVDDDDIALIDWRALAREPAVAPAPAPEAAP